LLVIGLPKGHSSKHAPTWRGWGFDDATNLLPGN
jgi:hypothetical protein